MAGAGLVHVRVCVPPPHVTEHVDQPEKPPLTTVPPEPEQPFDTAKPIYAHITVSFTINRKGQEGKG